MVPLVNKTSAVEIQTYHENSSSYKPLMQNKFASTVYNQAETLIVIMNIPRSISQPRKTISLWLGFEPSGE